MWRTEPKRTRIPDLKPRGCFCWLLKLLCFKELSSFSPSESRKSKETLLRRIWAFGRFKTLNE